jgi:ferredoxin
MRFIQIACLVGTLAALAPGSVALQLPRVRSAVAARVRLVPATHARVPRACPLASDSATALELALAKPLGLVLEEDGKEPGLLVAEVVDGGSAAASGKLTAGMRLLAINGQRFSALESAMDAIRAAEGDVRLSLARPAAAQAAAPAVAPAPVVVPAPVVAPAPVPPPAKATAAPPKTVAVTVRQEGKPDLVLTMEGGALLRTELLKNKVDVYTMVGKMTNCGGNGQCGTCVVDVTAGSCSPRTAVEQAKLKARAPTVRLACQSVLTGDITVCTKPK